MGGLVGEFVEFFVLFLLGSCFVALLFGSFEFTLVLLVQDLFQVFVVWFWFFWLRKVLKGLK